MNKTLHFAVDIRAPRQRVWDTMLGDAGYRHWTSAFCQGSHYVGSWDTGAKILFLAPNGDGASAVIAENRPHEFVSIRHLGDVIQGVEDTSSARVRAWAPAYENYSFTDTDGGTSVRVQLDTLPDYEAFMLDTYPKALGLLKQRCEGRPSA
jgi:hypothetical protein